MENLLHVVPLYLIVFTLFASQVYKFIAKKSANSAFLSSAILILCSIGITAGHHVHHGEALTIIDPCFGYAASLIYVAVGLLRSSKAQAKI